MELHSLRSTFQKICYACNGHCTCQKNVDIFIYIFFSSLTMSFSGILLMNPLSMKISFTFLVREYNIHPVFQLCSSKIPLRNLHVRNVLAWGPVYFLCGILCHICGIGTSHCSLYIPSSAKSICIDMELEIHTLMRIMSRLRLLRGLRHCEQISAVVETRIPQYLM
jgi:hypothetical protein